MYGRSHNKRSKMIHQLVKKIGLGFALTCGVPALALAQVPNVDTSKIDAAAKDAKQAKTAADETATTTKEGAANAKDTAKAVQKQDVQGAQEGAANVQKKAKKAKTSGTTTTEKAKDTAKDVTGK